MPASAPPVPWDLPTPCPDWHPGIQAIFTYWQAIKPAGELPGRRHFDPLRIAPLLPFVWLLDVQREPFRLRYRLAGTRVVAGIGREVTGLWLDEAHPEAVSRPEYIDRYRQVVATGIPSWRRGRPYLAIHRNFDEIENIFLPMAADGMNVDMILAMTVFHSYSVERQAEMLDV